MRLTIAALALVLAACSPAAQPIAAAADTAQDAHAGATGVGAVADTPFTVERETLVGTWSFDRTCASGDGMMLRADGVAGYDDWGTGTWAPADNNRVVLTLQRSEPGMETTTGETVIYNIDIAAPVTDELIGNLARPDGAEPRGLNARRCPTP